MKKIAAILSSIFLLSAGFIFAESKDSNNNSSSSFTSESNVKNAQLAISSNEYIVTAGDIYTLAYSGGSFSLSVDSTYKVRVANLGIVDAKGLTLQEFKNKVESLIINNYPTAGVQFFLANPAAFQVYIKGEVTKTGIEETWAMQRASNVIADYYTEYSSQRLFSIISKDGTEKKYDLFKATRYGDLSQDPYLRPGDTIVVNKLDRRITITGAVKRPGVYEPLPGEELTSLIFDYADGFSPYADRDSIAVSRFIGGKELYDISYLQETDLHTDVPLACYDKVFINTNLNKRPMINVEGSVRKDYNYATESNIEQDAPLFTGSVMEKAEAATHLEIPYTKGITCKQFISQHARMLTNSSDLTGAFITRVNSEGENTKIFINLSDVINPSGKEKINEDIILEPGDTIVIPYTMFFVMVNGAVGEPGYYGYQPGKTWEYYVGLASGIDKNQNFFEAIVITDKDGKKLSKKSEIPPEARINVKQNAPNNNWILPFITSIVTLIGEIVTLVIAFL